MGFGILFLGYTLFLNVTFPGYTDLIAGLVTLMAFYKLSSVNKYFRMATVPTAIFSVFGLFELFAEFADMFGLNLSAYTLYCAAPRHVIIAVITIIMLEGIEDVAKEVDVRETLKRVKRTRPLSYIIFPLCAMLEFPIITQFIPDGLPIAILSTGTLIALFVVLIFNLLTIYSSYMRICMPEDVDNEIKQKPSRFGFVNKFREHEEQKTREYAEYKMQKYKKQADKKRRK